MEKNLLQGTLKEISQVSEHCKHKYERKTFTLCLTQMLICPQIPSSEVLPVFKELLVAAISNLKNQTESETKVLKSQARKDINIPENFGKSKPKKVEAEEESKMEQLSEGEDSEYEEDDDDSDFEDDSDYYKDSDDEFDDVFDLKVTLDMLNSPFNDMDEFKEFKAMVRHFCQQDLNFMVSIQNSMDQGKKDFLKDLMQYERVQVVNSG